MIHPFDEIAPHPEGVDPTTMLQERAYVVRCYRKDAHTITVRGAVRDQKPGGLYLVDDPRPVTVHHMIVDLDVAYPSLEITAARVQMEDHPYASCVRITDHYKKLVGLSIARGYTHKVRELFGGPNGCTHTTALLQALAPAVIQATWSMRLIDNRAAGRAMALATEDDQVRRRIVSANVNTCHVWDEDSDHTANALAGGPPEVPLWLQKRYGELGRDPLEWYRGEG